MAHWGYSISKDNQIDFDKATLEVYQKVIEKEPSIKSCIACGCCSATCSSGIFSESISVRKLNTLVSRGQIQGVFSILEKCMLCGKCSLVCPRGINTRNYIRILKTILLTSISKI